MNIKRILPWAILGLIALFLFSSMGRYNDLVAKDESINGQWAQVEAAYQRRADLIPNLVKTVKGYADFEKETLTQVIEARSKATSVQIDANDLSAESMQKYQQAQEGLTGALSRLLVSVERYPDLKANQNFRDLQNELTNTENKIAFERKKFNDSVRAFNGEIRKIPARFIAGFAGLQARSYFESKPGTEEAPEVQF